MTLPLTSPFTSGTMVTKAQLDQLVTATNTLYQSAPRAKASMTAGQSVPDDGSTHLVSGYASLFTVGGMTIATNGIVVPVNGDYQINAFHQWNTNTTGRRTMHITINGSPLTTDEIINQAPASSVNTMVTYSTLVRANAGDKIGTSAQQSSGGALNLSTALLTVFLVGAN